jgi:hypothetical protein
MAYRPAHHICLSNCVVQVMRVLSLPALLLPLAKLHIRYGITQPTAYRINFAPKLWWPLALYEDTMRVYLGAFPAAQVARRLRTRPPRIHGSGAHDALQLQRIPFAAAQS